MAGVCVACVCVHQRPMRGTGLDGNRLKGLFQLSSHWRPSLVSDEGGIKEKEYTSNTLPLHPPHLLSNTSVCKLYLGSTTVPIDLISLGRGLLKKCCSYVQSTAFSVSLWALWKCDIFQYGLLSLMELDQVIAITLLCIGGLKKIQQVWLLWKPNTIHS